MLMEVTIWYNNPVYTGRIAFGRTRLERVEGTENEYRRVKSDDYILSDEVVHEPIISELYTDDGVGTVDADQEK